MGAAEGSDSVIAPLDFVVFKWGTLYGARHVNVLRDMLARHYHAPHRLTCITDDPSGIGPGIRIIPMWNDPRLTGHCMQRIRLFDRDAGAAIGKRFCWLDLDIVMVDDVTPIFSRTEDFIACGVEKPWQPYNGSMVMMDAGARPHVYADFSEAEFQKRRARTGYGQGDQGWIACALGPNEARWTTADGVYSYRDHIEGPPRGTGTGSGELPEGARLVIFNSRRLDPTKEAVRTRSQWIRHHWRLNTETTGSVAHGRPHDRRSAQAEVYRKLYKTARWQRIRQEQLRKEPLCQRCARLGRVTPATVCHHVDKASKEAPATFFKGPFESRCQPCHDGPEQQAERIGFETTVGADGWPTDPRHPANAGAGSA